MTKDNIFMFTAGVIGGAAGMLIAVKKYYEHIANEEIESVKETYSVEENHIKNGVINEAIKDIRTIYHKCSVECSFLTEASDE